MKIVNLKGNNACPCIYCGREMKPRGKFKGFVGSPLQNRYRLSGYSVEESIKRYSADLADAIRRKNAVVMAALREIQPTSTLGCWCVNMSGETEILEGPIRCHCQIIWREWVKLNGVRA